MSELFPALYFFHDQLPDSAPAVYRLRAEYRAGAHGCPLRLDGLAPVRPAGRRAVPVGNLCGGMAGHAEKIQSGCGLCQPCRRCHLGYPAGMALPGGGSFLDAGGGSGSGHRGDYFGFHGGGA